MPMDGQLWTEFVENQDEPTSRALAVSKNLYFVRFFGSYDVALVPAASAYTFTTLPAYLRPSNSDPEFKSAVVEATAYETTKALPAAFDDTAPQMPVDDTVLMYPSGELAARAIPAPEPSDDEEEEEQTEQALYSPDTLRRRQFQRRAAVAVGLLPRRTKDLLA